MININIDNLNKYIKKVICPKCKYSFKTVGKRVICPKCKTIITIQ